MSKKPQKEGETESWIDRFLARFEITYDSKRRLTLAGMGAVAVMPSQLVLGGGAEMVGADGVAGLVNTANSIRAVHIDIASEIQDKLGVFDCMEIDRYREEIAQYGRFLAGQTEGVTDLNVARRLSSVPREGMNQLADMYADTLLELRDGVVELRELMNQDPASYRHILQHFDPDIAHALQVQSRGAASSFAPTGNGAKDLDMLLEGWSGKLSRSHQQLALDMAQTTGHTIPKSEGIKDMPSRESREEHAQEFDAKQAEIRAHARRVRSAVQQLKELGGTVHDIPSHGGWKAAIEEEKNARNALEDAKER